MFLLLPSHAICDNRRSAQGGEDSRDVSGEILSILIAHVVHSVVQMSR